MVGKGVVISLGLVVAIILAVVSAPASVTITVSAATRNQVMQQAHDTASGLGLCHKAFEAGTVEPAQCAIITLMTIINLIKFHFFQAGITQPKFLTTKGVNFFQSRY